MATAQLSWTDRRGGYHCETGDLDRLAKKLETIRRPADLYLMDANGHRADRIGGCEEACGQCDDKRLKWLWWYESQPA